MRPTRTEAVKKFLEARSPSDLASLYHRGMECQVNVAQDGGDRIDGDFKGRRWHGWSDGIETWKTFRIPYGANTDEAHYDDPEMNFDLAKHVEGIGMTGWNWEKKQSEWVAFDFDALVGHSEKHLAKLPKEELDKIVDEASKINWVTVRRSASGKGIHLYVFLKPVSTNNHSEHAALARAILGKMSALTGFDFASKVDICGGNMWVWHRKMQNTNGLELIKTGSILESIPQNWRDHVKVVTGKRRKNLPQIIEEKGKESEFESLAGQRPRIALDEGHKKLVNYLQEKNAMWWWDSDHHMLITHTWWLQQAHDDLNFKGFFKTDSKGNDLNTQNCFCFPISRGSWSIRRYSPGCQEHESWTQDGAGWTRCYYNREPDFESACRAFGGVEDEKGNFHFKESEQAGKAASLLGAQLKYAPALHGRECILKLSKDNRLVVEIERKPDDGPQDMHGWFTKKNKNWIKVHQIKVTPASEPEVGNYDDLIRSLITETNEDFGWVLKIQGAWIEQPLTNVRVSLMSMGFSQQEVTQILGSAIFQSWKVVNLPFQTEYPGDRQWNRNGAQLRFTPKIDLDNLSFPTWLKILNHCGSGLNDAVLQNSWCRANGIKTGGEYLKCWVASLFQHPLEPLPYLAFWGDQDSGKSIFHEALSLLMTKGVQRADAALINQQGFNGELDGAVLCPVEETDLRKNKTAYNRIKDWVTGREILIHPKSGTPYQARNSTHWVQCTNEHSSVPAFSGDTRITMCHVPLLSPEQLIPKRKLIPILEAEAPDFLSEILNLEIPQSNDRLHIPVIETGDKTAVERMNASSLELFVKEMCEAADGYVIPFSEFYDSFQKWIDADELNDWSKIRVGRELPPTFPQGRLTQTGQKAIGNIKLKHLEKEASSKTRWILKGDYLVSI